VRIVKNDAKNHSNDSTGVFWEGREKSLGEKNHKTKKELFKVSDQITEEKINCEELRGEGKGKSVVVERERGS